MDNEIVGLLTTLLLGIFIVIGAFISLLVSKREKIIQLSIGLAFGVVVGLIFTDLLPEIIESFGVSHIYLFLMFVPAGFFLLKGLDHLVPDHHEHYHSHHHSMNKKENTENLVHIGVITTLALVLHNIVEGMAVYASSLSDPSLAFSLALGVGFHNIPLGMVISSSFYHSKQNKITTMISILVVSLSTFLGGFLMYLFHLNSIGEVVLGILLSITLGMLIYIVVDELFPRIKDAKDKKVIGIGIGVGILLLFLSMFFGE